MRVDNSPGRRRTSARFFVLPMAPIIQVENLVKRYGDVAAVDGVSFTVAEGEIFGLLGPNGAGKTTTLEIIETLKRPTSGDVTVDGFDLHRQPGEIRKRIGIQLQSAGFHPYLTLAELLETFGIMYDVPVEPLPLLRKFGLEEKAGAQYKQLSGGQQQRFSLATTLVNRPRVVFLDEPSTGLDPQARLNLWEVIREINREGVTVVLTTHYMEEAEQLCGRLAIMDHGRIIASGSPADLIQDLIQGGFQRPVEVRPATLEDVFIHLTGEQLREA
jgi:ABC-2 type transport system ATP-binding protein